MAGKDLKRRLTTLDASFLYFEKPKQPLHVGGCMTYEGHISRDELMQILSDRLHLLPRYRQKVVQAGIARHFAACLSNYNYNSKTAPSVPGVTAKKGFAAATASAIKQSRSSSLCAGS